jgi:hypothetical protein
MIKNLFLFFAVLGLFATLSKAQVSSVTGQYLQDNNILLNPGFESGIGKWVNSAGTFTADYTNFVQGKASGKIVLSSQALAFTQDSTSYVTALADGVQGLVSVYIKSEFAAKVCSRSAGVTITTNCVDVVGNNRWSLYKVPSILGATSNGISVNTNGTSVTGTIYIDESFVGITDLAADVDASKIAGEAYFAGTASCNWTRTSTTIGAFGTVAACPAPTIVRQNLGAWQTTDADLPRITVNNLPAGTYKAKFMIRAALQTSGNSAFAINDGTTTCEPQYGQTGGIGQYTFQLIECSFNYTSSGNRVFELYGGSTSNALLVSSDTAASPRISTKFILEYFGSSSVYAATANQNNVDVFSAKVSSAGVVSAENIEWINGNCTISDTSLFACSFNSNIFTVTPNCVVTAVDNSVDRTAQIDSASNTAVNVRTQTATTKLAQPFNLVCQKQGADFTATRLITGQFKELMTVPNVTKPKTCYYAFGGASATLASPTVCSTGTCVEIYDSCSTGSAPTFSSTGAYNTFSFASGTFANSSHINCDCVGYDTTTAVPKDCRLSFTTGNVPIITNSSGGLTLSNIYTSIPASSANTASNSYVQIKCEGQAP